MAKLEKAVCEADFSVSGSATEPPGFNNLPAVFARTAVSGARALGTGNCMPERVPQRNYFARLRATLDQR